MTKRREKVEGFSSFEKDPSTGSVINVDHIAYLQAKERKRIAKAKDEQIDDLTNRLQELESLVKSLLNKSSNEG